MLLTIFIGVYCFTAGLLAAILLPDEHCNSNKRKSFFCLAAGILWPLAIGIVAGCCLFLNIKEKIQVKRQARAAQMLQFGTHLFQMKIISKETLRTLRKEMK